MRQNNVQEQIAMAEFPMNYRKNQSFLNCQQSEQNRLLIEEDQTDKIDAFSKNYSDLSINKEEREALKIFMNKRK